MIVTVNKVYFLEHLSRIIQYSFTSLIYFKEMKYLRRTAGYTLIDYKRNETFLEEFHVTSLEQKVFTVHTDTIGSNTFMEWRTTGSLNNF
jgi:hypothetical protein